jgi:hypothetical protein
MHEVINFIRETVGLAHVSEVSVQGHLPCCFGSVVAPYIMAEHTAERPGHHMAFGM